MWGGFCKFAVVMNQDLDIVMLLRYVLTSHELWGSSCVGICVLLAMAYCLGLCFLRWYLRFASCGVFALRFLRGYLRFARGFNVNDRQLAVNGRQCFLACFARYGRQCFVGIARNAR